MGNYIIKIIILLQLCLYGMAFPSMAWEEISFINKATTPFKLKIDCRKKQGKYDATPTYICFEKDGELVHFDPGDDWKEVTHQKICLKDKLRDNIEVCVKIKEKQEKTEHIGCLKKDGTLDFSYRDPQKWMQIDAENPDCKPYFIKWDPPRGSIDMKTNKIEWDNNGKPE